MNLRDQLIRLASEHPEMRKHLVPILKSGSASDREIQNAVYEALDAALEKKDGVSVASIAKQVSKKLDTDVGNNDIAHIVRGTSRYSLSGGKVYKD